MEQTPSEEAEKSLEPPVESNLETDGVKYQDRTASLIEMLSVIQQETNFFLSKHFQLVEQSSNMATILQQIQDKARTPTTESPAVEELRFKLREMVNKNVSNEIELAKTSELLQKSEAELAEVKGKLSALEDLRKVEREEMATSHKNEMDNLKKNFQSRWKQRETSLELHFSNLLDKKELEVKTLRQEAETKITSLEEQLLKERRANRQRSCPEGGKRKAEEQVSRPSSLLQRPKASTEMPKTYLSSTASTPAKKKRVTFAPEVTKGLEVDTSDPNNQIPATPAPRSFSPRRNPETHQLDLTRSLSQRSQVETSASPGLRLGQGTPKASRGQVRRLSRTDPLDFGQSLFEPGPNFLRSAGIPSLDAMVKNITVDSNNDMQKPAFGRSRN